MRASPTIGVRSALGQGHSRRGRSTIVALAYILLFAASFVNSSGEGRARGELVENVALASEYHWMASIFLKCGGGFA